VELPASQVLADRLEEDLNALPYHFPYRDSINAWAACAAVALHAREGHSQITRICHQTPELFELVDRIFTTLRVQFALHALEPMSIVLGCDIHRLPQRPRRHTHRLSPFAMCTAFPCSDYYGDSAPRLRHRRAWRLADCFLASAQLKVPVFTGRTRGAVGAQLYP
jgi:hypothetical protein